MVVSGVCDLLCLSVAVSVHAPKENRLELSSPNLIHTHSLAGSRHALILRSKCQRSRSQGVSAWVRIHRCETSYRFLAHLGLFVRSDHSYMTSKYHTDCVLRLTCNGALMTLCTKIKMKLTLILREYFWPKKID